MKNNCLFVAKLTLLVQSVLGLMFHDRRQLFVLIQRRTPLPLRPYFENGHGFTRLSSIYSASKERNNGESHPILLPPSYSLSLSLIDAANKENAFFNYHSKNIFYKPLVMICLVKKNIEILFIYLNNIILPNNEKQWKIKRSIIIYTKVTI